MDCWAVSCRKIAILTQEGALEAEAAGLAALNVLHHMGFALGAVVLRLDSGMVAAGEDVEVVA